MAIEKILFTEKRETMKTAAERNGFTDDNGKASATVLKKALSEQAGAIREEQQSESGRFFEQTFLRVQKTVNACAERLRDSSLEQQSEIVASYLKSGFDSQVLAACVVAIAFGIKSTLELQGYVTDYSEYSDVIKRMKWLVSARRLLFMAAKANAFGDERKEKLSEGFAYLKASLNQVENQAHAYKMANFYLLKVLGVEFKGLQTADRVNASIAYLNACYTGQQDFTTQQYAGIFGVNIEVAEDTNEAPAGETSEPVSTTTEQTEAVTETTATTEQEAPIITSRKKKSVA